jgi:1,2-dihydroxy-3-keto-5-methylthiopentene dioxygenase
MKAYWIESGTPVTSPEMKANGIDHESLNVSDYQADLDRIKQANNYVAQDIVELNPNTPNLNVILAKFDKEHLHTDDEVRFVLAGNGIFDIRSVDDRWMRVEVAAGDYISVPANRYHQFFLKEDQMIRCVRLFKDNTGWTPFYRAELEKTAATV